MLVLSRKVEQSLNVGDDILVTVLAIEGDRVKLGIEAPRAVRVLRQEIFQQIRHSMIEVRPAHLLDVGAAKPDFSSWPNDPSELREEW